MRQFITSMSDKLYREYGRQFLERAKECLPGEVIVYTESKIPENTHDVQWRDLHLVEGHDWFLDGIDRFPVMSGAISGAPRNYRYDIAKFCHKSFAQLHAASVNQGEMWWIDSDVELLKPIPDEFFTDALNGTFMAYMDRPKWHSCASLLGFNNSHEDSARFWANYYMIYMTGQVFLLPEWHDSYLVDFIRTSLEVSAKDMAAGYDLGGGPVNVFDVVLDGYARHLKGNRKRMVAPARYKQLIDIVTTLQPRRVLEVGTWNGGRAIAMNEAAPGLKYFGFDLFETATAESDEEEKNVKPHHDVLSVSKRLEEAGVDGELFVGNTRHSLPQFIKENPKPFDLIFIDGGHSIETIESDLDHCLKIIEPGGVIVMDDWYSDEIDTEKFGCNKVLEKRMIPFAILPIADPVAGGGSVKMVVLQC